jgi:hypothetical protein
MGTSIACSCVFIFKSLAENSSLNPWHFIDFRCVLLDITDCYHPPCPLTVVDVGVPFFRQILARDRVSNIKYIGRVGALCSNRSRSKGGLVGGNTPLVQHRVGISMKNRGQETGFSA